MRTRARDDDAVDDDAPIVLFVYGTLLSGATNHDRLRDARFAGGARTVAAFELVDCGAYPGMTAGGATAIEGELYEVDRRTLADLDRFEGHPRLFRRSPIALDDGRTVQTYLLVRAPAGAPRIRTGAWRSQVF